ncbi:MAG: EAL domain-containing protein [Campylobacterota bacterium]|nr:EAL domain-containing protein [Campylobacterota bacterium]
MKSDFLDHLFTYPRVPEFSKNSFYQYSLQSDKVMLVLFVLQWLISTFISSIMYETYAYGFVGGALVTLPLFVAYRYFKGTSTFRNLVAIGMMLFSLIYIQQHLGRIEMHFHIFIAMAILTLYKDVIPIFVAAVTTILHHVVFNYLQLYEISLFDMPVMVFNYGCGFDIVLLHGLFVILEALVLGYIIRLQIEHAVTLNQSEQEILELNSELEHTSLHDSLTGLPNRLYLESQVEVITSYANRYKSKFAVLFLDLDHFKNINDTLGHDFGDELLKMVSQHLKSSLRANDLISRIGGDEFIIILTDIKNMSAIEQTISKILEMFRADWLIKDKTLQLSASIGVSIYPDDSRDINELMKFSDIAMYKAKEEGRDNFNFFTEALDHKIHEEVAIFNDMQRALKEHEFKLFYQPKVEVRSGKVIGAEALIRWQHPQKGLIFPDKFIHIAENTRFILPLGKWVIEEACRMISRLDKLKYDDLHVSLNVSTRQFQFANLYEDVRDAIQESGIDGSKLAIEITESIMMLHLNDAIKIMDKLKSLDVHICMDDFGTGYSSLAYLQKFSIDSLKIDKSFVDDVLTSDSNDDIILNTIIAMGKSLNLHTIAEGIETVEQLKYLEEKGCPYYQGYLFSKAVPEDEFMALLEKNRELTKEN